MKTYKEWKEFKPDLPNSEKIKKFDSFWEGGEYNRKKSEIDLDDPKMKKQIQIGIEVEKEHTTDPEVARRIALDHLAEFPDYYTALKQMEKTLRAKHQKKDGENKAGSDG